MDIEKTRNNFLNTYAGQVDHLNELLEEQWHLLNDCSDEDLSNNVIDSKTMLLMAQKSMLSKCQRCKLHKFRTYMVFGEGNSNSEIMFIGEGPGHNEDETGRPFVGKAGQLLDKIIESMQLNRKNVYIANLIKCRPPSNRDPEIDEIIACRKFLDYQIEIINPKIIIVLGSPAVKALLETTDGIMNLRGKFQNYKGISVLPTFHPAYLLRNPSAKKDTWEDIKKVIEFLKK